MKKGSEKTARRTRDIPHSLPVHMLRLIIFYWGNHVDCLARAQLIRRSSIFSFFLSAHLPSPPRCHSFSLCHIGLYLECLETAPNLSVHILCIILKLSILFIINGKTARNRLCGCAFNKWHKHAHTERNDGCRSLFACNAFFRSHRCVSVACICCIWTRHNLMIYARIADYLLFQLSVKRFFVCFHVASFPLLSATLFSSAPSIAHISMAYRIWYGVLSPHRVNYCRI